MTSLDRGPVRPFSIYYLHHVGLDYVSWSPFRIPLARLEAGRGGPGRKR
jgi:phosphoenolpyruvate synthase/pyruvate phosphate dikinase